jgi:starch synthase (maltosyl-transferring)
VKRTADNAVITVVNMDPVNAQAGAAVIPAHLNLPPSFTVRDLLSDGEDEYAWRIGPNYVRLEPGVRQAHVMQVIR